MNAKSKQTKYFTAATAGHVDHGKTSLLKALTGIDPDRLKEEKARGMTTDLGFAHWQEQDDLVIGFIDVPGHGKFLKNMLAGVGGAQLALLAVAANEGPMPQTYEHVRILALSGIAEAIVAITKCDLVDKECLTIVEQQVRELLSAEGISAIGVVAVSCSHRTGIDTLKTMLVKHVRKLPYPSREGAIFLPVDRVFSKPGFGTVITGTLVRGCLTVGDEVFLQPGAMTARVRRLETFGRSLEQARAGQRLAVNLVLKDGSNIVRGHVLTAESLGACRLMIVHLVRMSEQLSEADIVAIAGQPVRFYHGTAEYHGKVRWIDLIESDRVSGQHAGYQAIAAFAFSDPVVAEAQAQDRFVIRLSNDTIHGGTILLCDYPRWFNHTKGRNLAQLLISGDFKSATREYVKICPRQIVSTQHLKKLLPARIRVSVIEELVRSGDLTSLADFLVTKVFHRELTNKVLAEIAHFTEEQSAGHGQSLISLELLRSRVMAGLNRTAFQSLIQDMVSAHLIVRHGDKITLPGQDIATVNPEIKALADKVYKILADNVCIEIEEIAKALRCTVKEVTVALQYLSEMSFASIVDYDYASSRAVLTLAHRHLFRIWQEKGQITPSEFREALGTSRKYAMALLAYFDDRKITRRVADGRVLLSNPPN